MFGGSQPETPALLEQQYIMAHLGHRYQPLYQLQEADTEAQPAEQTLTLAWTGWYTPSKNSTEEY